jgi:hypothetical protein
MIKVEWGKEDWYKWQEIERKLAWEKEIEKKRD